MAINFTYNPNEYEAKDFEILPVGDYRVGIEDVQEKTFKSGNQGFEITLAVAGKKSKLWFYLVLSNDSPSMTNQRLGEFFHCFDIKDYDLNNYLNWIGRVGAVRVKHDEYNGSTSAKVHYLLNQKAQEKLPAWEQADSFQQVDVDVPW